MHIRVCGHFGTGNAGDETALHALVNACRTNGHEIGVYSLQPERTHQHFDVPVWHADDRESLFDGQTDRLWIGGGDLGPGFGWNLLATAAAANIPVDLIGQTFGPRWHETTQISALAGAVFQVAKTIAPRDEQSYQRLLRMASHATIRRGADPAFLFSRRPFAPNGAAVVCVRHHIDERTREENVKLARKAVATLQELPSVESVRLVACADDDASLPLEWTRKPAWDWQKTLDTFAAELVVSIGRMHPIVFATVQQTASMLVPLPVTSSQTFKLNATAEHLEVFVGSRQPNQLARDLATAWKNRRKMAERTEPIARREQQRAQYMISAALAAAGVGPDWK